MRKRGDDSNSTGAKSTPTPAPRPFVVDPDNPPPTHPFLDDDVRDKFRFKFPVITDDASTHHAPLQRTIFGGLLDATSICVWLSDKGTGSSTLMLQMAICAAAGKPFLGFPFTNPNPCKVHYLDYASTSKSLDDRATGIAIGLGLPPSKMRQLRDSYLEINELHRFIQIHGELPRIITEGAVARNRSLKDKAEEADDFWRKYVSRLDGVEMVFIDPFKSIHAMNENESFSEELMTKIRVLFRGKTVVLSHALRKSNSAIKLSDFRKWIGEARGSTALLKSASLVIGQDVEKDKNKIDRTYFAALPKTHPIIEPIEIDTVGEDAFFYAPVVREIPTGLVPIIREMMKSKTTSTGHSFASARELQLWMSMKFKCSRATAFRYINWLEREKIISIEYQGIVRGAVKLSMIAQQQAVAYAARRGGARQGTNGKGGDERV